MRKRIVYLFLVLGFLLPAASSVQRREVAYMATEQKDAVVCLTKTTVKYHREGSKYFKKTQSKIDKKKVFKNGYGPRKSNLQ